MEPPKIVENDKSWCDVLNLPQVTQGSQQWLAARCMKQTGSDFAAVIPRTEEYVGHIFDRWQYPDVKYSVRANCAKSLTKQQYYKNKCLSVIKFKEQCLENLVVPTEDCQAVINDQNYNDDLEGAMSVGKRFENLIRNATIQILGTHISEIGWVENLKTQGAGVSPDGIVHCTVLPPVVAQLDGKLISYGYGIDLKEEENTDLYSKETKKCTRSFEAKTLVTRQCEQRVPLQYHMQVEKNMYELGLESSIYSEAGFIELSLEEWKKRKEVLEAESDPKTWKHLKLGCLLLHSRCQKGDDRYVWPHAYVRTPDQFLTWRDMTLAWYSWKYPDVPHYAPPEVIYFEMETFWCTEIPLWPQYDKVYGPIIKKEIETLNDAVKRPEEFLDGNKSTARSYTRAPKCNIIDVDI